MAWKYCEVKRMKTEKKFRESYERLRVPALRTSLGNTHKQTHPLANYGTNESVFTGPHLHSNDFLLFWDLFRYLFQAYCFELMHEDISKIQKYYKCHVHTS